MEFECKSVIGRVDEARKSNEKKKYKKMKRKNKERSMYSEDGPISDLRTELRGTSSSKV